MKTQGPLETIQTVERIKQRGELFKTCHPKVFRQRRLTGLGMRICTLAACHKSKFVFLAGGSEQTEQTGRDTDEGEQFFERGRYGTITAVIELPNLSVDHGSGAGK